MLDHPDLSRRPSIERIPINEVKPTEVPYRIIDPRKFMFLPLQIELLPQYQMGSFIGSPDRKDIAVKATTWNELPAVMVSFTDTKFGNHMEYDVVPSRDYAIVRWRLYGEHSLKNGTVRRFDDALSCTVAQIASSIWFPSQIDWTPSENGKAGLNERVILTPVQVNTEIPDKTFSLAGGRLPSKQLIITHPIHARGTTQPDRIIPPTTQPGVLYWKDGKIGPMTREDVAERVKSHKEFRE